MSDTGGNPWATRISFADPRIGAELEAERLRRGWTGENAAAKLGWSPSKICRIEGARTSVTARALEQLIALYAIPEPRAGALRALNAAAAARRRGVLDGESDLLAGADLAGTVREWAPQYVPRLLQTPAYAEALANSRQRVIPTSPAMVRAQVAAVTRWQDRLTGDPPCQVRAVLDESVLRHVAGDDRVMRAQLGYIAEAGDMPGTSIEVRVLPFGCPAPSVPGGFIHMSYPPAEGLAACPDGVLLENLDGLYRPDLSESDIWKRQLMFGTLWELAEPAAAAVGRVLLAVG